MKRVRWRFNFPLQRPKRARSAGATSVRLCGWLFLLVSISVGPRWKCRRFATCSAPALYWCHYFVPVRAARFDEAVSINGEPYANSVQRPQIRANVRCKWFCRVPPESWSGPRRRRGEIRSSSAWPSSPTQSEAPLFQDPNETLAGTDWCKATELRRRSWLSRRTT